MIAQLFTLFCAHVGLRSRWLLDYVKGDGYEPGASFERDGLVGHAWNAVLVRRQWRLVDVQWGSLCALVQLDAGAYILYNEHISSCEQLHVARERPHAVRVPAREPLLPAGPGGALIRPLARGRAVAARAATRSRRSPNWGPDFSSSVSSSFRSARPSWPASASLSDSRTVHTRCVFWLRLERKCGYTLSTPLAQFGAPHTAVD